MAVWQVDFYIVKDGNRNIYDETLSFDDNEMFLDWESGELDKESLNSISKILKPEKSWSHKTLQYGNIDETCIEISYYDDNFCNIFIRLDVRNLNESIISKIIEFININNGFIVYQNRCYDANKENISKIIEQSNAKKFCINPYEFLKSIKKDQIN